MYACTLSLQGLPLPSQEFNAVDVVVRYAVSGLGFAFEDIILFAWSIGKWLMGGWWGGGLSLLSLSVSLLCVPLLTQTIHTSSSTGGYTASCAAMSYPDIGAVVSYVHVYVALRHTCNNISSLDCRCLF